MTFVNNLKWSAVGALSRYVLQTISILILSRLLAPSEFGQVAAVLIVISLALVLSQLGMNQVISSCSKVDVNKKVFHALLISPSIAIVISFAVFLFSGKIVEFFSIGDSALLYVLLFSVVIRSAYSPLEGLFSYFLKFEAIAKVEFISYFFGYFFVGVSLAYFEYGSYSLVFAILAQSLIALVMLVILFFRLDFVIDLELSWTELWETLKRACAISYGQILSGITSQTDNYFVNKYLGLASLGIYTRAYQLMVVPCNFAGQIINRVIISRFAKGDEDHERIIIVGVYLALVLAVLISSVIVILGLDLVDFLLGNGWTEVFLPLLILSFSIFPRMVYKITEPVLIANGLEQKLIISLKVYLFCTLGFCYFFRNEGVLGISVAVLISTGLYGAVSMYNLIRVYSRLWRSMLAALFVYVLSSLLIWSFR